MKKSWLSCIVLLLSVAVWAGDGEVSGPETAYGGTPGFRVWRANGHPQGRRTIKSGDVINSLVGYGFNGTSFTTSGGVAIKLEANQDWSTTANGTKIIFETTPDGSTSAAEVMSIDDDGNVTISGTLTATGSVYAGSGTEAELKVTTPTAAGLQYYDSTNKAVILSTGSATCGEFGLLYDGGTVPTGW
jgi:hypothetical protein